ncbi:MULTISPECIES: Ig-like domain-containing protein [Exiguobacterium]|uniref:Ig-like domain-containing protein n=1 Tax=Exiguobacterium TaxID=33986 RepID=UPI001BEC102E|nr:MULTISPECIES: Ig-like domain-containing protein [Exiguobacterium]MCT4778447.1 hypothetical protein [Exiguobacterium aquaticum]MCT4790474.1 hypothetical protein [Exiguobacterium mexicanum]
MKKWHYLLLFVALLFVMFPVGQVSATPKFELGTLLEQEAKTIEGSPFYLDYQDGFTRLHDVKRQTVVPIDFNDNLTANRSYDEDGAYGDFYTFEPSLDGEAFMATHHRTGDMIHVNRDGSTRTFSPPFDTESIRLITYDVSRDMMIWENETTGQWMMTDLNGATTWVRDRSSWEQIILATNSDEIVVTNTNLGVLLRLDVATGETIETIEISNDRAKVFVEPLTDHLLLEGSSDIHMYDMTKQTITKLKVNAYYLRSFESLNYHDGVYYAMTSSSHMVTIDLTTNIVRQFDLDPSNRWYEYEAMQEGYMIQNGERLFPMSRFHLIPVGISTSLKAVDASGDANYWLGESYQLMATVTTLDEVRHTIPVSDLGPDAEVLYATRSFDEGYIVPSFDESFSYAVRFGKLTSSRVTLNPVTKVPLQIDTSFTNGPVGEITGTTSPNMTVYVTCENNKYASCDGSVTADETGRFTFSRGILWGNQTITVWAADNATYNQATKASVKQTFQMNEPTETNIAEVLTETAMEGVTIRTKPNVRVEVRQLFSPTNFEVREVQADATGVAKLTEYNRDKPMYYRVIYRILDTNSPYANLYVSKDYPIPDVTWTKPPKTGDTTLTIHNGTLAPMVAVYRNGRVETSKRLVLGTNVITLKEPLWEGQTIRMVASFRPELSKTFEQIVTSDMPKTHSIKDVLVTSSTSTFTVLKDAKAYVHFYVNGRQLPHTEVGKDRYRISVKPGMPVVVESSIGSKKKRTTYKIPTASLTSFAPSDEVSTWSGKTLPNATVTVKAGTKVIGRTTVNSTGSYQVKFTRQRAGTKLVFEAKVGVARDAKSATVKAGVRPTVSTGTIRSTTKSIAVRTNVPYGTVTIYNGKTLVAKKTITSTSTNVSIKPQKRGSKLTITVVTPANRSGQTVKTVL